MKKPSPKIVLKYFQVNNCEGNHNFYGQFENTKAEKNVIKLKPRKMKDPEAMFPCTI